MHADDEPACDRPCAEALWAGTLALMTTYAAPTAARRDLIARKVVSNLFFLARHPALSAALRQVVERTHGRWVALADAASTGPVAATRDDTAAAAGAPPRVRWH